MLPVSQRFLDSLRLARWIPQAQWSPNRGETWLPLTLIDGDVTASSTSQVRWTTSGLTLAGAPLGRHGLSPYGSRVRLSMGLALGRHDIETVPLGVFRVEDVSTAGVRPGRFQVTGAGLESQVMEERFLKPRRLAPGAASYWVERLIREVLPEVSLSWRLDDVTLPEFLEDRDRWGLIDGRSQSPSIAKSLGGRVFADARGQFVAAPVPTLEDPPVWSVHSGDGGVLVEPQHTLERKGVYNTVVASGVQDNGKPPVGPVVVSDEDPVSPTYVKGPFGQVPLFYESKLLTTIPQCEKAARGILATRLGLKQKVTASAVLNPALEPDDVISVELPDGTTEPHVIDSITYPLTGGPMRLSTRATQSRQAGVIALDARRDDYGEGQFDE